MLNKNLKKMKTILFRSVLVALLLGVICFLADQVFFHSLRRMMLVLFGVSLLFSAFLLYVSDQKVVQRLKKITPSMISPLVWIYLIISIISLCYFYYAIKIGVETIAGDKNVLMFTMYPLLMTIFSFRYFIVVVRVMAKNMD